MDECRRCKIAQNLFDEMTEEGGYGQQYACTHEQSVGDGEVEDEENTSSTVEEEAPLNVITEEEEEEENNQSKKRKRQKAVAEEEEETTNVLDELLMFSHNKTPIHRQERQQYNYEHNYSYKFRSYKVKLADEIDDQPDTCLEDIYEMSNKTEDEMLFADLSSGKSSPRTRAYHYACTGCRYSTELFHETAEKWKTNSIRLALCESYITDGENNREENNTCKFRGCAHLVAFMYTVRRDFETKLALKLSNEHFTTLEKARYL